jgi:hypothetical protein
LLGGDQMSLVLTDVQKVTLKVNPVSAAGNPAQVDGAPVWSSSDDTVLSLSVSEDGFSAEAVTTGKLGVAQVNVSADVDMGEGVKTLTGVLDVEVKASEAVSLNLAADVPVDR